MTTEREVIDGCLLSSLQVVTSQYPVLRHSLPVERTKSKILFEYSRQQLLRITLRTAGDSLDLRIRYTTVVTGLGERLVLTYTHRNEPSVSRSFLERGKGTNKIGNIVRVFVPFCLLLGG